MEVGIEKHFKNLNLSSNDILKKLKGGFLLRP